jgi:hypothetical protein
MKVPAMRHFFGLIVPAGGVPTVGANVSEHGRNRPVNAGDRGERNRSKPQLVERATDRMGCNWVANLLPMGCKS